LKIKLIKDEAFSDYKKPYMFIGTCQCNFKCCTEAGLPITVCQNEPWVRGQDFVLDNSKIVERYLTNPITQAIVIGGMEPFDQFIELFELVSEFRKATIDDIIIYTGYYPEEIENAVATCQQFPNIIIKFGRFIPNQTPHFDGVLGVNLASDNQYAQKIS